MVVDREELAEERAFLVGRRRHCMRLLDDLGLPDEDKTADERIEEREDQLYRDSEAPVFLGGAELHELPVASGVGPHAINGQHATEQEVKLMTQLSLWTSSETARVRKGVAPSHMFSGLSHSVCREHKGSTAPRCVLCHNSPYHDVPEMGVLRWCPDYPDFFAVHDRCAYMSSQLVQVDEDELTATEYQLQEFRIDHIRKEFSRSKKLRCVVCKKQGASVKCAFTSCNRGYHGPCAVQTALLSDPSYGVWCGQHDGPLKESLQHTLFTALRRSGAPSIRLPERRRYDEAPERSSCVGSGAGGESFEVATYARSGLKRARRGGREVEVEDEMAERKTDEQEWDENAHTEHVHRMPPPRRRLARPVEELEEWERELDEYYYSEDEEGEMDCCICTEPVDKKMLRGEVVKTYCCGERSMHYACVQSLAVARGQETRCPSCNGDIILTGFHVALANQGIYVPAFAPAHEGEGEWMYAAAPCFFSAEARAGMRRRPRTEEELARGQGEEREQEEAVTSDCQCPDGAAHYEDDTPWEKKECGDCGTYAHRRCLGAPWSEYECTCGAPDHNQCKCTEDAWYCSECKEMLPDTSMLDEDKENWESVDVGDKRDVVVVVEQSRRVDASLSPFDLSMHADSPDPADNAVNREQREDAPPRHRTSSSDSGVGGESLNSSVSPGKKNEQRDGLPAAVISSEQRKIEAVRQRSRSDSRAGGKKGTKRASLAPPPAAAPKKMRVVEEDEDDEVVVIREKHKKSDKHSGILNERKSNQLTAVRRSDTMETVAMWKKLTDLSPATRRHSLIRPSAAPSSAAILGEDVTPSRLDVTTSPCKQKPPRRQTEGQPSIRNFMCDGRKENRRSMPQVVCDVESDNDDEIQYIGQFNKAHV